MTFNRSERRLSDSLLQSSWREHVSQALDSAASTDSLITSLRPKTMGRAPSCQVHQDSVGLCAAKNYLIHLAGEKPALDTDDSELFLDRFKCRFVLQETAFANIFQAADDVTRSTVILKAYDKRFWTADLEVKARREASILRKASHPNVVDLLETVETSTSLVLVTEHCTHGDLVRELVLNNAHDSRTVFPRLKQIIQAVNHIHKLGYIHCAINPSTILLKRDNTVCLCNMFHALEVGSAGHRAGLLEYMPPEMISLATREEALGGALARMRHYPFGPAVDAWQIGCLAYEMLAGRSPFEFENPEHTATAVLFAHVSAWPPAISPRMQSFISSCLRKEPEARPTLDKLLEHPALNSSFAIAVNAATTLGAFWKKVLPA